jgi:hypothetical protein
MSISARRAWARFSAFTFIAGLALGAVVGLILGGK